VDLGVAAAVLVVFLVEEDVVFLAVVVVLVIFFVDDDVVVVLEDDDVGEALVEDELVDLTEVFDVVTAFEVPAPPVTPAVEDWGAVGLAAVVPAIEEAVPPRLNP